MAGSASPRGLIIDLITPIGSNGKVEGSNLDRLLDRVVPYVDAALLCGPDAGMGPALGQAQRLDMLLSTMRRVKGRISLIVWITGSTQEKTSSMLEVLEKGADKEGYKGPLYWLDTPLIYHSNRGLPQHCKNVTSFTSRSLLLFNDPERVKRAARPLKRANIRTSVLKEIAHLEGVCALVFRGGLDRARNYQKAVRFKSDFRVYDGDEGSFLNHPSRHGVLSAGANLAPAAWRRITDSSLGTNGNEQAYPDQLKNIWELGRYLEALREIYSREPSTLIGSVLERTGLLAPESKSSPNASREEDARRLHDLMKEHGDA